MPENCTHDCSTCGESCSERDLRVPANALSSIKKVIAVVSGKGGVGKSTVTSSLAVAMARRGRKVAVLDADITGPSIPMAFGVHQRATGTDAGIDPAVTPSGIKLMSLNLLTANETDPVVWRGPVIANVVKQFWSDVVWGEVDYMFVDMPPGRAPHRVPVPAGGRHHRGHLPPGSGVHDRLQGGAHGGDDVHPGAGPH